MVLRKSVAPVLIVLLCIYSVLFHHLAIGLPGIPYPRGIARLVGWPEAARNLQAIQEQLLQQDKRTLVAGMDTYFIASKLAYYGTPEFLGGDKILEVTGSHLLENRSLMFAFWNPAAEFSGANIIMLARSPDDLSDERLLNYFESLSPDIRTLPIIKDDFGLPSKSIRDYYYRIGFDYQPPR